jgi:hypothetical protein
MIFLGPKDNLTRIEEFHGGPNDFLHASAHLASREALQFLHREYSGDAAASSYFDHQLYPTDAAAWEHFFEQMATLYGEALQKKNIYRTKTKYSQE